MIKHPKRRSNTCLFYFPSKKEKKGCLKDLIILLMSLPRSKSFFKEYARSGYEGKMNPEFDGMARKYYRQKKQHEKVHTLKAKLDQQVAFMQRMEKRMEQHLTKKQNELRYAKEVSSRAQNDLRRREWIHQFHSKETKNNQQKASLIKSQSAARLQQAKEYLREQKRSMANLNRSENQRAKDECMLKRAKDWDSNRSRVHQIYQMKKEVKQSCNQFYQSRTDSSFKNYQSRISIFQEYKQNDHENIISLERRLEELKQKSNKKKEKVQELGQQINKMRQEAKLQNSLIRSQIRSRSSLSSSSLRSGKSPVNGPVSETK